MTRCEKAKNLVLAERKMTGRRRFNFGPNNIIEIQKSSKINQLEEIAVL
ncbi:MAG: hypothetical protein JKY23_05915 [Nitrospinaceae bacterium]|nr:hypothetical protein [Nitrospinaceae bacterium]